MANTAQNNVGFSQAYIDRLELAQKDATGKLKEMSAYYNSASLAYNDAKNWEDKIKFYWENIERTEDLAKLVITEMEKLDLQIESVCFNAGGYVKAVKILVCCVKDAYSTLDLINDEIRDLITRIDCAKSKEPSLDSSKSILKCLDEYRIKHEAALAAAILAMNIMLELLKNANLVLDEKRGMQSFITYLWYKGGLPEHDKVRGHKPPEDCHDMSCYPGPMEPVCEVDYDAPCELVSIAEKPSLSIEKGAYYIETESQKAISKVSRHKMDRIRKEAQIIRDGAQSKYDAATRALADAKAAKDCK